MKLDEKTMQNTEAFCDELEKLDPNKENTIFLSGAISKRRDTYKEYFCAAEEVLTKRGWKVYNPAYIPSDTPWEDAMRETLNTLLSCQRVFLLNDYEDSTGVASELKVAEAIGLPVHKERG